MPYVSATVLELFRIVTVIPFFPRLAMDDVHVLGYKIPKVL